MRFYDYFPRFSKLILLFSLLYNNFLFACKALMLPSYFSFMLSLCWICGNLTYFKSEPQTNILLFLTNIFQTTKKNLRFILIFFFNKTNS